MESSYYHNSISIFKKESIDTILASLSRNHSFSLEENEKNAWINQIKILQKSLEHLDYGHIFFEYSIPRMGKRVDCIVIVGGIIFCIEFKVGETSYPQHAIDQTLDYAIDLKNFHEQSHDKIIVPVLVSSEAKAIDNEYILDTDKVCNIQKVNKSNIYDLIKRVLKKNSNLEKIDYNKWLNSNYKPTPTIIEAAKALYQGHDVREISRSDSGAFNLSETSDTILKIIDNSKQNKKKSICFITGVPGSGKTLAGLNIANKRNNYDKNEHTVFLS